MVSSKPIHRNDIHNRNRSRTRIHRGLLALALALSVLLQGCFLDRLITLRSQTCSFDEYFAVGIDQNIVIELVFKHILEGFPKTR